MEADAIAALHNRTLLLQELHARRAEPSIALGRLAMLNGRLARCELRTGFVGTARRVFPAPQDVSPLLSLLIVRLQRNFQASTQPLDDLYTAALAFYGIVAIHPFDDGNGRTAIDFAQYLLMLRWGASRPPLLLPPDAHELLAATAAGLEPRCDGESAQALWALREDLARRIGGGTLETLKANDAFSVIARSFEQSVSVAPNPDTQGTAQ